MRWPLSPESGSNSWSPDWNCPRSACKIATCRSWLGRRKRGTLYPSKNHLTKFPLFAYSHCSVQLRLFRRGFARQLPPLRHSCATRPIIHHPRLERPPPHPRHFFFLCYLSHDIHACQNHAQNYRRGIFPRLPVLLRILRMTICHAATCARTPPTFCP